jgi:hypothetical protein
MKSGMAPLLILYIPNPVKIVLISGGRHIFHGDLEIFVSLVESPLG